MAQREWHETLKPPNRKRIKTLQGLADEIGVNVSTVRRWNRAGMLEKSSGGYDCQKAYECAEAQLVAEQSDNSDYDELWRKHRAGLTKQREAQEELRTLKMKGELIEVAVVKTLISQGGQFIQEALMALPDQFAPKYALTAEQKAALKEEIRRKLTEAANMMSDKLAESVEEQAREAGG